MGGVALIELYQSPQIPWQFVIQYLNKEQYVLEEKEKMSPLIHLWLYDPTNEYLAAFKKGKTPKATIDITGTTRKPLPVKNVVGMMEGTDPALKDEYMILSAHYDHVGVKKDTQGQDSIYNGARDNAIGIAAMISAAQYFSEVPPKRSVLFLACTAEEVGLLGSQWYADHPLLSLDKMAFNLNCDGAGYNDTTIVTVIGLERTNAEEEIRSACQAYGLTATTDPVPEQNLYDRSDNVSFAQAGIPSVNFALGISAFDQEVMKYYHQVADEVESLNFDYLDKFFKAYLQAADNIANMPEKPFWQPGDKYEEAGKMLYGR
jgi:Zn-dependent M28 family amino/carboxypeptidase